MKNRIRAILFDLDGVLVDSIEAWYLTLNVVLESLGRKPFSKKDFISIWGQGIEKDVALLGMPQDKVLEIYREIFPRYLDIIHITPGAENILKSLDKKDILKAVVTNSPRFITDIILKHTKLNSYFQTICCGNEVPEGKPHPALCLRAMEILGVTGEETLMIGDTENDIKAGKSAGCHTIGFRTKGDLTIQNLDELLKLVENDDNFKRV